MLLHIPHGYELVPGSPFQTTDIDQYVSEVKLQACSTSCDGSVQIIEVRTVSANSTLNNTKVLVTGAHQDHEVIVAHVPTDSTGQDGVLNAPFAFVQKDEPHRAVHYSAWIPTTASMNITSKSELVEGLTQTLDLGAGDNDELNTEMTLFRNCIWITEPDHGGWPTLTIEIKRGGKTKKVMVSTNDGSVGTGDKESPIS